MQKIKVIVPKTRLLIVYPIQIFSLLYGKLYIRGYHKYITCFFKGKDRSTLLERVGRKSNLVPPRPNNLHSWLFQTTCIIFCIFYHFVKIIWHMYLISIALEEKNRFILYTWRCGCGWHRLCSLELRNVQSMSLDFLVEAVKMLYGQSEGIIHCFAPRIFKRSWTSLSLPYEPRLNVNVSLTRYVKFLVAHAPRMPGTFSPPPTSK